MLTPDFGGLAGEQRGGSTNLSQGWSGGGEHWAGAAGPGSGPDSVSCSVTLRKPLFPPGPQFPELQDEFH